MADQPMSAQTMARAARFDPQFAVPTRPRVRRGLVVRRDGDRLVVDGTPTRHVLRGKAATEFVPRMLPLLDGARDHAAIAGALGVSTNTVFTALSLLWTTGIVEEAAPDDVDVSWVPDHLADYLSRVGDSTEANPAWEHAAARLAAARVTLHGDPAFAAALADALAGTLAVTRGETGGDLVVLATTGPDLEANRRLIDACWAAGTPLLRVALDGDRVEIGPYVDPRLGPCLDCLTAGDTDGTPAPHHNGDTPALHDTDRDLLGLAAGLAAADLVALISRAARVGLPTRWRRVGLTKLAQTQLSGATRPGCPACGTVPPPPGGAPRPAPLAARYEAAVALPPREYADVKAHQVHYQPANVAIQRGHKTWPVAPRRSLPVPDVERLAGTPAAPAAAVTLDDLSLLLMVAAGWQRDTPDRVWRWSATGGNIGSVAAHVLVRDIAGLAPGVYGYVPAVHELALLRGTPPPACPPADASSRAPVAPSGTAPDRTALHHTDPDRTAPDHTAPGCTAAACLLLTADLTRVASKYGAFGLRVVLLDAGCAYTAVLDTADWLGLDAVAGTGFADATMSDALGTDLAAEPVTGLIHLGVRP